MNQVRRSALGRGLSALIPDADKPAIEPDAGGTTLPLDQIKIARVQPRTLFKQDRIDALADSIKKDGLLQPIVVRRVGQQTFTIIAGERRYRAATQAGLQRVPVTILDVTESEAFELALIENIQREDLNPIEEAEAYEYLSKESGLSHENIAQRVGRDRVSVTNTLRLLKLTTFVRQLVSEGKLSAGHARALLMAPVEFQEPLAKRAVTEGWSVRQTERTAKASKTEGENAVKVSPPSPAIRQVEDQLRTALGAPVKLINRKGKGKIEIRFHSLDELDRLIDLMATLEGQ